MKKKLILESGEVFHGEGFGAELETAGEVVFNTGMTGYQELISDPSYCGQIVCMTYPLIGNYGINRDDYESIEPAIKGLIVKEVCDFPSNFRTQITLDELFKKKNLSGISGIDTRRLTRILRNHGVVKGKIVNMDADENAVVSELKSTTFPTNQVEQVSTKTAYANPGRGLKVVLVDFGSKLGIIRELSQRNCDITVVSQDVTAEEILLMNPDGVMLSNGPGDPEDNQHALEMIRGLLGKVPIFGICLGHQLIGLACGAKTFKLKFGHRGGNHPVLDLEKNKVAITSQNHGYAVDQESLKGTDLMETHIALNDRTNEGLKHKIHPCFSVQYHPEASPGPEDANYLFDDFIQLMEDFKNKKN
ncbi:MULTISPECIES: carbamoyl phosphate synthase small subunit [Chryseobacterium]|uniref:Carbamoyl phosphate synthase small chain n=1 Tax=Chryseobacterium geocarposphaerae TaxID=1416776 RepID=A0ABU1L9Q8_9FLAO|nr:MULTISPECIES: carbamoyl phosphate synthase small subunit [Chryseobacterium]ALR29993.1 carbamoyl-phosphate synthase small subunit [Chryseobacterium sp. IHB B 17019]MDR6403305.1 carbamoyl-phosphate synthase small subunit [Chryseobacterium geocarposphaerae]MDR6696859.1 carbamoyl-phosphate synthase small subunit [Chryseobacterium ginsenosidimutans]